MELLKNYTVQPYARHPVRLAHTNLVASALSVTQHAELVMELDQALVQDVESLVVFLAI